MEISELTLKLILLLIPGAVSSIIFEKLTIHRKWTPFQFVSNSIIFGGGCYLLTQFITSICGNDSLAAFWSNLPTKDIPYENIIYATIAAPFMGLSSTAIDHFRLINKLGKALRITNKYGDLNLFTHFLNSPDVTEIYVRDIEKNITYHGKVHSYSETDEIKELLLFDVDVYNYVTNELCYALKSIYITTPRDKMTIEIPEIQIASQSNTSQNSSN